MSINDSEKILEENKSKYTPEQWKEIAKRGALEFYNRQIIELEKKILDYALNDKNGLINIQFELARYAEYLKKIREENFFETFKVIVVSKKNANEEIQLSVYDFFKEIIKSMLKEIELHKDDPEKVLRFQERVKEAQEIIEAIKKMGKVE